MFGRRTLTLTLGMLLFLGAWTTYRKITLQRAVREAVAKQGGFLALTSLLRQGAEVEQHDKDETLKRAVWADNRAAVAVLLRHGGNPNYANGGNATPFFIAAGLWGDAPTTARMLDAGAKVNKRCVWIDVACAGCSIGERSFRQTALSQAAANGHTEVVRLLLSRGADPNIRDEGGSTALQRAENSEIGHLLRRAGANQ